MKHLLYIFTALIIVCMAGCSDEEFTTNPSDILSYSADTVCFDTVFTTLSSSTTRLMVYNKNKKAINIGSIELKNASTSGFRVNVDGMKGSRFQDIEISKKDSLYILVEVTVNPTGQDSPVRQEDILEFSYNGVSQKIILEAFGQDAIFWRGKVISTDTIIESAKPLLIYDSLVVSTDTELRLMAGSRLFFHDKAVMEVKGRIIAEGEINNPVVMRGNRLDNLFDNLPYDKLASQWGGVNIAPESFGNEFYHTQIRGTSTGIRLDSSSLDQRKLYIESCKMGYSGGNLLHAENVWMEAANSELTNSAGSILHIRGGRYRFTHCTLSNLYKTGAITGRTVSLSNYRFDSDDNMVNADLLQADFNNCIIWGKAGLEVNLDSAWNKQPVEALYEYKFVNCLIKAKGEDDNKFVNTVWDEDPAFMAIGDDYIYDFRLSESSAAIGNGFPAFAIEYPTDLQGQIRNPGACDIGAYQAIER